MFCLCMALGGLLWAGRVQKALLSLVPSKGPCLSLSDDTLCDLALVIYLIFHCETETNVMKLRAQQRSLAFHLPGVRKKGLVWRRAPQRMPLHSAGHSREDNQQKSMRSHRRCPTWQVCGSARGRDTLMNAAGRHFSS